MCVGLQRRTISGPVRGARALWGRMNEPPRQPVRGRPNLFRLSLSSVCKSSTTTETAHTNLMARGRRPGAALLAANPLADQSGMMSCRPPSRISRAASSFGPGGSGGPYFGRSLVGQPQNWRETLTTGSSSQAIPSVFALPRFALVAHKRLVPIVETPQPVCCGPLCWPTLTQSTNTHHLLLVLCVGRQEVDRNLQPWPLHNC